MYGESTWVDHNQPIDHAAITGGYNGNPHPVPAVNPHPSGFAGGRAAMLTPGEQGEMQSAPQKRPMNATEAGGQIERSDMPSARSAYNQRLDEAGVDTTKTEGPEPYGPQNTADLVDMGANALHGLYNTAQGYMNRGAHALGLGQPQTANDRSIDLNNTPNAQQEASRRGY